jgi:hypothetical protein
MIENHGKHVHGFRPSSTFIRQDLQHSIAVVFAEDLIEECLNCNLSSCSSYQTFQSSGNTTIQRSTISDHSRQPVEGLIGRGKGGNSEACR